MAPAVEMQFVVEIPLGGEWLIMSRPMQADVDAAVAWRFTRDLLPDVLDAGLYPKLGAFAARAEALPAFRAAPAD